ncbi:CLUMA_CG009785, isoform A [Clunio marinus]|uniref:CLUMA_CG009785, isoform A n=1 Tax=Clunio marinus TaxID=568069 RepID=A0A1J1I7X6_9DIPT|nr:CLUMA_CG009785, isoform A [Clunio marinus]
MKKKLFRLEKSMKNSHNDSVDDNEKAEHTIDGYCFVGLNSGFPSFTILSKSFDEFIRILEKI